ncbi:MAG: hypothetical protein LBJ46_05805 [Planctomycetota bacterium]|nr:hypothetical protein [Planctomycetota bacterium]
MKKWFFLLVAALAAAVPAYAAEELDVDAEDFEPTALEMRIMEIEQSFFEKVEDAGRAPGKILEAARGQREAYDKLLAQVEAKALEVARREFSSGAAAALAQNIGGWKTLTADLEKRMKDEDPEEGEVGALVTIAYLAVQRIELLAVLGGEEVGDHAYE